MLYVINYQEDASLLIFDQYSNLKKLDSFDSYQCILIALKQDKVKRIFDNLNANMIMKQNCSA